MKADQEKWNAKYRQTKDKPQICPAVERFWPLAPPKSRALDLAAGASDELAELFRSLAAEEAKHKLRFEIEYDDVVLKEN